MTAVGRAPVVADLRALILGRVLPRWHARFATVDELSLADAQAYALELLAETRRVEEQLPALQAELAHLAALAGATHEQRGAAVGLGKERARRLWPWPAKKVSLARGVGPTPAEAHAGA